MQRLRSSDVLPIEVWDLCVSGGILGELTCSPGFPAALSEAIQRIHAGCGATRSNGPLPSRAGAFDALLLTGGRSQEAALIGALRNLPCPFFLGEGLYAAARGGLDGLQRLGLSGWVLDLGQSQLKIIGPERRWVFARDWTRLRAKVEVLPSEEPAHRRRLREFIALSLRWAMNEAGSQPAALVAALPTRIGRDGTPAGSSYAGMRGDRLLLPEALELAGLHGRPLFVLNDAELAAWSARLDPRLAQYRKVLVLTLGFGIGAAILQRRAIPVGWHGRPARAARPLAGRNGKSLLIADCGLPIAD